ncbi:LysR family transcriptional regulator [bacterium]|nr:LysR family transcriptional regulator [bacterium]MBU1152773.1 LysR family transcriptional regulator [bacterium]
MLDRFSLRTFYTLSNEKSFSNTANILCLSQPAVSHQIHILEEALEARLFDRIKGEVSLTPAGEILFKYARDILNLYQKAEKEIADLTQTSHGRLVIGASTTIGQYLLPTILGKFKDLYPKFEIFLTNANTKEITSQLLNNLIDLGLVEGPVSHRDILVEKFIEDELVVIASVKHHWQEEKEIEQDEFKKEPIIFREQGSGTRKVIEEILEKAEIKLSDLNIKMELGSSEAIKSAVETGLGIGIISQWAVLKEKKLNSLKILRIKGLRFQRDFTIILKHGHFRTKPMEQFLSFLNPTS